jgi:hypothetical protein
MEFRINKGVGKAVEFYGLQAQYIWYLFGGLVGNFMLFAIIYLAGTPPLVAVLIFLVSTAGVAAYVMRVGKKYGEHGQMMLQARNAQPRYLVVRNPGVFRALKTVRADARMVSRKAVDKA